MKMSPELGRQFIEALPLEYKPRQASFFNPETVVFARGSLASPERERFAEKVCGVYPKAQVVKRLLIPASRIRIEGKTVKERQERGSQTLVLGEIGRAVHTTEIEPSIATKYWYFSTYCNCPYGCRYCYLKGARGVWFSPAVRVHVNLEQILAEIDKVATRRGAVTSFYHGRLQDPLALDPLTGFSTTVVPFFAEHRLARQILLTKAAAVDNLLPLEHGGHTTICWSLIPPEVAKHFEENVPSVEARIIAMKKCAEKGYRVRAAIQPVLGGKWRSYYAAFVERLVREIPLDRLGFGGVYINGRVNCLSKRMMNEHFELFKRSKDNSEPDIYEYSWCKRHYGELVDAAKGVRRRVNIGPIQLP